MRFFMTDNFSQRHIGPDLNQKESMLKTLNVASMDELILQTIPNGILMEKPLELDPALSEVEYLNYARKIAQKNIIFKNYIGQGYYECHTPSVILRNILENPGWYTAYTPYQAEISQGRMEALLNFQTMIMELTGLPLANASLLDEGTAAAEAMSVCYAAKKNKSAKTLLVDKNIYPQTLDILRTRAAPLGLEIRVFESLEQQMDTNCFALLLQYPDARGCINNWEPVIEKAHQAGLLVIMATDLLGLCLLKSPGDLGADIAIGSTQRFGVPMGYGGPHAAFFATKEEYKRLVPGRIIGVSKDSSGQPALRLSLQTREQHIRREKATSNICTAQVLLAVMSSMYAVYHGPKGLKKIATKIHHLAQSFANGVREFGYTTTAHFFDTVQVAVTQEQISNLRKLCLDQKINLGYFQSGFVNVAWDETKSQIDLKNLLNIFAQCSLRNSSKNGSGASAYEAQVYLTDPLVDKSSISAQIPQELFRQDSFLQQKIFNSFHSETEILRYIHRLEVKDLSLNHSMIPLGSCTMKLNASAEMIPITWPEFANIHPFAPLNQAQGYMEMIHQLEFWLKAITGFSAISFQPNAGSQGEYAGLLVIKKYLQTKDQIHRQVCLIPSSAHGTNPASAVMAGFKVVVVQCDSQGNIDLMDLKEKAEKHSSELAALMVTYPSTHGVFEESIKEICDLIHKHGGQIYMDGANMNAMVGLCQPAKFGVDVSHLNLHKTFCIPHGGGGPGVGPIGVAAHLKPFLPKHVFIPECGPLGGIPAVSAAPWGSANILPISWGYLAMMGGDGLKQATETAILNANYIAKKLEPHFPLLYTNKNGRVAHECIVDLRSFKDSAQISVDDVAKRLMDFGFHAPTMSWPVAGTLMIEPTESESQLELDRFIEAMIQIRTEIRAIQEGSFDPLDNPLKNAPHTVESLLVTQWNHSYTREQAAFPLDWVRSQKFWPSVGRIDNAFGDKNLVCSCDSF
ncbi:MAG: aminomethyl-transferring glycine dehydrogenase [Bdellovibrionales bacterium]|nr:aminomethyl-transferring glycine dehydrogenase [Bdellovibrionales bacterium]